MTSSSDVTSRAIAHGGRTCKTEAILRRLSISQLAAPMHAVFDQKTSLLWCHRHHREGICECQL